MDDNSVKKALKGLKDQPSTYPPELKTATRAEYVTLVRTQRRKPGCPFFILVLVLFVGLACKLPSPMSSLDWLLASILTLGLACFYAFLKLWK